MVLMVTFFRSVGRGWPIGECELCRFWKEAPGNTSGIFLECVEEIPKFGVDGRAVPLLSKEAHDQT